MEKLELVAENDSEKSDVAENLCRSKSRAVYRESPIKLEKFPVIFFNQWDLWVKQCISVV